MKILKIIRLMLERLRNEEHFQFMSDVFKIVSAAIVSRTENMAVNINSLFSIFGDLLNKEDIAVASLRKSGLTDPIAESDNYRDMIYRGLVLYVQAYLHSADTAQREAAQRIQVLIDNYGDIRTKSYNEETAAIYNLLQDMQNKLSEQIETIDLNEWISNLEAANNKFESLMSERYDESLGGEDMREIRREIDSVYRQIVSLIEIENKVSGGEAYADVIEKLNERVSYYKTTLAVRKGRADAKKEGENEI